MRTAAGEYAVYLSRIVFEDRERTTGSNMLNVLVKLGKVSLF